MVVVFDEDDAILELRHAGELIHLLDELFAGLILRMRLAGEDELHRALRVFEQLLQTLRIGEEQGRTLVSRETPREADRQNFGIEQPRNVANVFGTLAEAGALPPHTIADKVDQPRLEPLMGAPDFLVRNVDDAAPEILVTAVGEMFLPFGQISVVESRKVRCHPGLGVNAVGDRS